MHSLTLRALSCTVLLWPALALGGPPANDDCVTAELMTCDTIVSGSTTTANGETLGTCGTSDGSAGGVWYRFIGTGDTIAVTTCSGSTNYDTKIRVYTGSCGALVCVGGDDDSSCSFNGLHSRVEWLSDAGVEYFILVHGFSGSSGNFDLTLDCLLPPEPDPNDQCANATVIGVGAVLGDTRANDSDGSASCGNSDASPSVWYRFTPTEELLRVQTCGSSYDTVVSVHSGCPGDTANELGCNDDGCGQASFLQTTVTIGQDVLIRVSGSAGAANSFTLDVDNVDPSLVTGADVIYSDCTSINNFGEIGGVRGYALGSHTCNIGDENLQWGSVTPLLAMNAYRLADGRLEQIGMSWVKNGTGAAAGNGCGPPCNGQGGSVLGAGCLDVYGSGFNGIQSILGPRSQVNAFTGSYPGASGPSGTLLDKRLQIPENDLSNGSALYFVEGVYVAPDDAASGNAHNNASYKRVTVDGTTFNMTPVGAMQDTIPAIFAWRDHGLGIDTPDPSVTFAVVDVPNEGRFHVASKVTNNKDGTWHYEYAIFNINSHRSGGSFTVPVPNTAVITDIGFHDIDYHTGEPYDATDWSGTVGVDGVTWSSPATFGVDPNSNALRWGTMYNFWFDADASPVDVSGALGLFMPGTPSAVAVTVPAPFGDATIPAASTWTLIALAMVLLTAGSVIVRRRGAAAA